MEQSKTLGGALYSRKVLTVCVCLSNSLALMDKGTENRMTKH